MKRKIKQYLPLLITIPFFLMLARLVNGDFYYDELFTFRHYIFVPLRKTIFVYENLNNHFLFSVIGNLWMRLFGGDLNWLMDRPYIIRLPLLIFPAVTIFYLYRIGIEFFNRRVAILSVLMLITTIPYYYYVLQVRGYSLSMMFITIILYYMWKDK